MTWDNSPTSYFSVIEVNVGIFCACILTLRPLLRHLFPRWIKDSYPNPGGYGAETTYVGTKKPSRDTMTHADHGIYGLADLEVDRVLNSSQEALTKHPKFFEPAHFSSTLHHKNMPRMSTSITGGGGSIFSDKRAPATAIKTRSGDIMVTRETTIMEETRSMTPASGDNLRLNEKDHMSWLSSDSTDLEDASSNV